MPRSTSTTRSSGHSSSASPQGRSRNAAWSARARRRKCGVVDIGAYTRAVQRACLAVTLMVAFVAAGCGGTTTATVTRTVALEPPRDTVYFGHIASLGREDGRWELR